MKTFFNILIGIITVIVGACLLLTDVMSYVQPISALYILCPLTLFFSTLFILTLFFAVYWFFSKNVRMGVICVLLMVASVPNMLKTYSLTPKYETKTAKGSVSVMTYNVHLFDWFEGTKGVENAARMFDYINAAGPDIVCLQEMLYYPTGTYTLDYVKSMLAAYPYCQVEELNNSRRVAKCIATFSKYPIVDTERISLNSSCHGAMKSKIAVGSDTISVLNFYLKSNQLTQQEKDLIPDTSNIQEAGEQTKGLISKIYNKLVKASLERCEEANKVSDHIRNGEERLIVCGDMNDIPASYAYRTISSGLNDAFLMMTSWSLGSTFHEGVYNFRIDYIFTSNDLTPLEFSLDKQRMSDHYPLMLKFLINN